MMYSFPRREHKMEEGMDLFVFKVSKDPKIRAEHAIGSYSY